MGTRNVILASLTAGLLALSCHALPENHTDPSYDAVVEAGTFSDPSVNVRPKFRYWIPDASVDPAVVASDVQAAGNVGAGGLELLGYYLYGGPPSNGGGRGTAAPVDWATYGFGTPAWHNVFQSFTQAIKDNGLIMDFAIGPNQGTGVPAIENSDGLEWDIAAFNVSVPIGGSFDGILPGWGTGTLEAAVTALATGSQYITTTGPISPDLPGDLPLARTQITLNTSSLTDVTSQVGSDGHLTIDFDSNVSGINFTIFAIYLIHSDYRAQDGPEDLGGPQTPATSFVQNGSWSVDHFSALGARTTTNFWEQYILNNGTRELLMGVGNYGWEDSVEIDANVYWTQNYSSLFEADHGYSIAKYLPILFHQNGHAKSSDPPIWWVTDEEDTGDSHVADYRKTLGDQYHAYLTGLNTWAEEYLDLQFSAQISYNLPMDMLSNIPAVDAPECESLDFSDLIDGYRQYSGPANFARRRIVSSECGAVKGEAYVQLLPELMWKVKRSYVGGINQFVFHGFPYSGDYGNTTWPVFTTFDYAYSSMHGPHEPAWDFYRDQIDFVARNNFIFQSGKPEIDIAFWQKITTYPGHIQLRTYEPSDLEEAGYTYEYLSPDNFDLPSAYVENGVLAPDAQAFKALVVRANDSLTFGGVSKLVEFAEAGLPIIFSGGIPSTYLHTTNASAITNAERMLNSTASLKNVHVTNTYAGLASTIASIGVLPATKVSTNGSWFTLWRTDNSTGYVIVYNDAMYSARGQGGSKGTVEFASTGVPYKYDAWTGSQSPILVYNQSNTSTTMAFDLAGNQSTIVAFLPEPLDPATYPKTVLSDISDGILDVSTSNTSKSLTLKSGPGSSPQTYTLSNGTTGTIPPASASSTSLLNWNLTVEHWDPPSNLYNISGGAKKYNTTHVLPTLISWQSISGLKNTSGRGYYTTTFTWPPRSTNSSISGALISFPPIVHTLNLFINSHPLPPLDVTAPIADITPFLIPGVNTVEAVVATPLGNVLIPIWNSLMTSGTGPSSAGAVAPPVVDYGIIGNVVLTPYLEVEVALS